MRSSLSAIPGMCVLWALAGGCVDGPTLDLGGPVGPGASDDASTDAGDSATPPGFGDGGVDGAVAGGCSGDLHQIVDSHGNVVQTCPPDQGCANGRCVAACDAAAASHGDVGCDFLPSTPSFFATAQTGFGPPCWAIFLTNNWTTPAKINVTYDSTNYDVTGFGRIPVTGQVESTWPPVSSTGVPQGQVAVLFISSDPGSRFKCPVPDALDQGTAVSGTGRGKAWHITTDAPVSAYDILPYGGASSALPGASLLYPTTAWGTNYIAVVPKFGSGASALWPGPQWGQIVAAQDGTQVKIVPTAGLPSGTTVSAAPPNAVTSYTLDAGDFIQWQNPYYDWFSGGGPTQPMEMSGSVVSSDKPIAFIGGNAYVCLGSEASTGGGCDSDHEQIAPVSALGSVYAVAPYATRRKDLQPESLIYRIVGSVDGTIVSYDPAIAGAPSTLNQGQWVDFESTTPFVVKSQDANHPFYVGQMMPGCQVTSGSRPPGGCLGDEDYVSVMPPAQFLDSYIFFTDGTYPTTTLTLVRGKSPAGFEDVELGCFGTITGWQPLDSAGSYQWATFDLVRGDVGTGACKNGPNAAKSAGPFGLTVWGEAEYASYGYPAGGNVAPINTVVVPPVPR
jgi:hypothetical protein